MQNLRRNHRLSHNKSYATNWKFAETTLEFLREKALKNWSKFCVSFADNFRGVDPNDFRVLACARNGESLTFPSVPLISHMSPA